MDALLKQLGADGGAVLSVEAADGSEGGRLLPHLNWPCTLRHAFKVGLSPALPCGSPLGHQSQPLCTPHMCECTWHQQLLVG